MANDGQITHEPMKDVRVKLNKDLHQAFKKRCIDEGRVMATTAELLIRKWMSGEISL